MTELIIPLDVDSRSEAISIVLKCDNCYWFKIGSQLFTRCGPYVVDEIHDRGKCVMLDLKFHDIPNTVNKAAKAAANLGVSMFTLHASGGRDMISAAREVVEGTGTKVLAVTVLTSLSETMLREEVGLQESPEDAVVRLAAMAVDAGAHGIVCSPLEVSLLRTALRGYNSLIVTPGIRPTWANKDDQVRVATPREAAEAGANFVVVGRPILNHKNPTAAVTLINEELAKGESL